MFRSVRGAGTVALAPLFLIALAPAASAAATSQHGRLVIVQAVPSESFEVAIDGRTVGRSAHVGSVLGPFTVSPGSHKIRLTDGTKVLQSTVDVKPGSSHDVVVHLPAQVDGSPVVNTYTTPRSPIPPGKARVLLAHTATAAPADVRLDGKVVFRNIANGEFATGEVAAGKHTVALLPTGRSGPPILGPLDVDLSPGTITMAYAYGNPRAHSMNVIVHRDTLTTTGAVAPVTMDTGEAGLVAHVRVATFPRVGGASAKDQEAGQGIGQASSARRPLIATVVLLATAVALLGISLRRPPRRR